MKAVINYNHFAQLEIRIGKVMEASIPEGSQKLIRQVVDFGDESRGGLGVKTIFSGIKQWFTPDDLVGKHLPYVVNLEPRKMPFKRANEDGEVVDELSEGMLLAVAPIIGNLDDEKVEHGCVLLEPNGEVKPGDEVV